MTLFLPFAILLSLAVAFYIAAPLRARDEQLPSPDEERIQHRDLREQSAMLRALLRELETDRQDGKISPSDFETLRAETQTRADEVQAALDATRLEKQTRFGLRRSRIEREAELEIAIMRQRLKAKQQGSV